MRSTTLPSARLWLLLTLSVSLLNTANCQTIQNLLDNSDKYYYKGAFIKALEIARQAGTLALEDTVKNAADYAKVVGLYYSMNNEKMFKFDSAEYYYLKGIDIYRQKGLLQDTNYAITLVNLGNMYNSILLRPNKAKDFLEEGYKIVQNHMSPYNFDYPGTLNNMGLLYYNLGQFSLADDMYSQCMNVVQQYHPNKVDTTLVLIINRAELYKQMGLYERAYHPLYNKLKSIREVPKRNTRYYETGLLLLNELCYYGKHPNLTDSINQILERVKTISSDTIRVNLYITFNSILKFVFWGKPHEAIKVYNQFKQNNPNYVKLMAREPETFFHTAFAISDAYLQTAQINEAGKFTDTLFTIANNFIYSNKQILWSLLTQQAHIHLMQKDYPVAKKYLFELGKSINESSHFFLSGLTESQKWGLTNKFRSYNSTIANYLDATHRKDSALLTLLFNNHILLKRMLNTEKIWLKKQVELSQNKKALELYNNQQDIRNKMGELYLKDKGVGASTKLSIYIQQEEEIEKELQKIIPGLSILKDAPTRWEQLSNKLQEGEAIVSFVKYFDMSAALKLKKEVLYAAIIVLPGNKPLQYIPICTETELMNLTIACNKNETFMSYGNLVRAKTNYKGREINPSQELYKLVWKKIDKLLTKATRVFYLPNGRLHTLPFDAFVDQNNRFIRNKYSLEQLQSFWPIIARDSTKIDPQTIEIWGNIDYNLADKADTTKELHMDPECFCEPFSELGKAEIDSIVSVLDKQKFDTVNYSGPGASETKFKQIKHSSRILHISTHGFYIFDPEAANQMGEDLLSSIFDYSKHDALLLVKTGIALAGINKIWKKSLAEYSTSVNREDGILFGYELKDVDLSAVDLVIVSACETSLGRLTYDEGVIGLQTALKLAGANKIITALWQIDKSETVEWMKTFYKHYNKILDVEAAYDATQKEMSKKSPPYSWAGFVLTK